MLSAFPIWNMSNRHIAHIDLDCFFVSVERIHDPGLNGKPVAVGGSPDGRGVVASASYEARAFGVRSAMPMARALRLCPSLVVVRGRHGEYGRYSNRLYRRMLEVAPVVERASIDEMYLDFTGCEALYNHDIPGFMKQLQLLVREEFSLPCTIALSANKLVSKIAANTVKPNGVIVVPRGTESDFLAPLPVSVIPGVGPRTEEVLHRRGVRTVRDLQQWSLKECLDRLGAHGEWLNRAARGEGSDVLTPESERKSISEERTFGTDVADPVVLERKLRDLAVGVSARLRSSGMKARTVVLKLRWSSFETLTRRCTIPATNYDPDIVRVVRALFRAVHAPGKRVRLLGVGVSNLERSAEGEPDLFPGDDRKRKVLEAADSIRDKFGDDIIRIGDI